jgi:hypothetical protein
MPTIRSIVREAEADDFRFSSLILSIAKSTPFRMRMVQEESESAAAEASRAAVQ